MVIGAFFRAEVESAIRVLPQPVSLQKNAVSLQKTEKLEIVVSMYFFWLSTNLLLCKECKEDYYMVRGCYIQNETRPRK